MIERKCPKCGVWNKDEDYCNSCRSPLSPVAIDKQNTSIRKEIEANKPLDKFDVFQNKLKNSDYFVVRIAYKLVYSVFVVLGAFGAFMAWLAAMVNV